MRFITGLLFLLATSAGFAEPVDYSLPDMDGKQQSLADYRGKWVVVNYWATWCPPCQEEMPDLVEFHERHKDKDAVVIGINYEDIGHDQLAAFVESFMITYPIWRSDPVATTPLGAVPGLPTTYIISPDGTPLARQVGPVTVEHLENYIKKKQAEADAR